MKKASISFTLLSIFIFSHEKIMSEEANNVHNYSFSEFLDSVETSHPENKLDLSELTIAKEKKQQSGYLPDPMISFARENMPVKSLSKNNNSNSMLSPDPDRIDWSISISQKFPWFGSLSAENSAANAIEKINELNVETKKLTRKYNAASLYIDYVTLIEMQNLQRQSLLEAEKLMRYAELNFSSGTTSHGDLLQFQNELELLKQENLNTTYQIENYEDNIMFLIGKKVTFSAFPNMKEIQDTFSSIKDINSRKIVANKEADILKNDAEKNKLYPKITTNLQLMRQDNGMFATSVMLGIDLPIFSGFVTGTIEREKVENKKNRLIESEIYEKNKAILLRQIDRQITLLEKNNSILSKTIVPNLKEHLKAEEVDYSKGKKRISGLIEAKKSVIKYELSLLNNKRLYCSYLLQREAIQIGIPIVSRLNTGISDNTNEKNENKSESQSNGEGM